jgi:tetratricopeptide (TPR) repeat protein
MRQGSMVAMLAERSQLDFELAFFRAILERLPDYTDVLRSHAANLKAKGLIKDGLLVEQRLSELEPHDPSVFYQLACRYAVLKQPEMALKHLEHAFRLGYREFRTLLRERDLTILHHDPRFQQLIRQYGEL